MSFRKNLSKPPGCDPSIFSELSDIAHLRFDRPRRLAQDAVIEMLYTKAVRGVCDFIDGGANRGRHCLKMAALAASRRVVAFEPSPSVASRLSYNITDAGLADKCLVRIEALGSKIGIQSFTEFIEWDPMDQEFNYNSCLSALRPSNDLLSTLRHVSQDVLVTTIDEVVTQLGLNVGFIKLDLEGGEFDALVGAHSTIRWQRPLIAFEDSGPDVGMRYGYKDQDMLTLFSDLKYDLYYVTGHTLAGCDWLNRNSTDRWRPLNIFAIPKGAVPKSELRAIIDSAYREQGLSPLWA